MDKYSERLNLAVTPEMKERIARLAESAKPVETSYSQIARKAIMLGILQLEQTLKEYEEKEGE